MRLTLVLAVAVAFLPACKSSQPQNYEQMKKKVPDAKPTLYVAEDDQRYVATSGDNARQIHYYSVQMDRTYVVDEKTGVVVTTFQAKEMPGVVVIDKPTYQPPPLKANEPKETPTEGCAPVKEAPAKEGCGCAPKSEGCGEKIEKEGCEEAGEVEGCEEEGCEAEGCGK